MKIAADSLKNALIKSFEAAGLPSVQAGQMADNMVFAEASGVYSHGIALLDFYIGMLEDKLVNPNPDVKIVEDRAASAMIDADNGFGMPAVLKALDIACEKAETCGCAAVGLRHFNHYGAGLYYAYKAAERGKILYMYCNADAQVAVPGASCAFLGTNPITYGTPAGRYAPFILDMATSVAAWSKMRHYSELPAGWGIDRSGHPAKTMEDVVNGGALLPFGGLKGYGLSLMVNVLSAIPTGAHYAYGTYCVPKGPDKLANIGSFMQVIDVAAFMDMDEYSARMEDYIDLLHANPPRDESSPVRYPGEMEGERRARAMTEGIELSETTEAIFRKSVEMAGLTFSELVK